MKKEIDTTITESGEWTCDVFVNGEHEWDLAATDDELKIRIQKTENYEEL